MPFLSVVTVLYQSRSVMHSCIDTWARSAAECESGEVEFVFIHNDGDSYSYNAIQRMAWGNALVKQEVPRCNLGFAGGSNYGAELADGYWLLFLNPDVMLEDSGALSEIVRRLDDIPAEESECLVALPLQNGHSVHVGTGLDLGGMFWDIDVGGRFINSVIPVGPSGGAMGARRSLFQELGGFDERLFAWGEDVELGLRASRRGYGLKVLRLAALRHLGGHSVRDTRTQRIKDFYLVRNRIWILRRHFSSPFLAVTTPYWLVAIMVIWVRHLFRKSGMATARGVLAGIGEMPNWRDSERIRRIGVRTVVEMLRARKAVTSSIDCGEVHDYVWGATRLNERREQ